MKIAQAELIAKLDRRLPALASARASAIPPARGWLRAVRTSLGLTQPQVARQLAMTRQSLADLEAAEARGAISLASLSRVSAAMDCELVYFMVPKDQAARSFQQVPTQFAPLPVKPPPLVTMPARSIIPVYLSDGELPTELK